MIDSRAYDFLYKLYYEDHYVIYNGNKYFFNGCQFKKNTAGEAVSVRLEVYNLSNDETLFSITKPSAEECVEALEEAAIWNGKTFWEVENQMRWVDE